MQRIWAAKRGEKKRETKDREREIEIERERERERGKQLQQNSQVGRLRGRI